MERAKVNIAPAHGKLECFLPPAWGQSAPALHDNRRCRIDQKGSSQTSGITHAVWSHPARRSARTTIPRSSKILCRWPVLRIFRVWGLGHLCR